MALTIDDIYDKEFALKGGGYDRDDVDQFLDEICDEMTNMQEKIASLEDDLAKARMEEKAAKEAVRQMPKYVEPPVIQKEETPVVTKTSETLESILLNAQRLADDAVETAKKRAQDIVREAEEKAGQIVDDAQEERDTIVKGLATLKSSASEYRKSFQDMLQKQQEVLDGSMELFREDK